MHSERWVSHELAAAAQDQNAEAILSVGRMERLSSTASAYERHQSGNAGGN